MKCLLVFLLFTLGAGADEIKGKVVSLEGRTLVLQAAEPNSSLRIQAQPDQLRSLKQGDRVQVTYSVQKVAIARDGRRECVEMLTLDSVKKI